MDLPKLSLLDKLSTRELVLFIVTILVVVGLGYYKLEWESLQKQRKKLTEQVTQVEQSVKGFQAALGMVQPQKLQQDIDRVKEEIETLKMEIDLTKGKMTEKIADIMRALGEQAKSQRAQLLTFNSREKRVEQEEGTDFKEVTLLLTIKSNYGAIGNFLDALEQIPAVLMVRDMEIKRHRDIHPRVETEITLKLFVL